MVVYKYINKHVAYGPAFTDLSLQTGATGSSGTDDKCISKGKGSSPKDLQKGIKKGHGKGKKGQSKRKVVKEQEMAIDPSDKSDAGNEGEITPRYRSAQKTHMILEYGGDESNIMQAVMKMSEGPVHVLHKPAAPLITQNRNVKKHPSRGYQRTFPGRLDKQEKGKTKHENEKEEVTYHQSDMVIDFLKHVELKIAVEEKKISEIEENNLAPAEEKAKHETAIKEYYEQIKKVLEWIVPNSLVLSQTSRSGSWVLQGILQSSPINDEQRREIAKKFHTKVWECAKNQHANFVLTELIIRLGSSTTLDFIFEELAKVPSGDLNPLPSDSLIHTQEGEEGEEEEDEVAEEQDQEKKEKAKEDEDGYGYVHAARHRYSCRVLERLLEHGRQERQKRVIDALIEACPCPRKESDQSGNRHYKDSHEIGLTAHAYGNYVIKAMLKRGNKDQCRDIVKQVIADFDVLSKHRIGGRTIEHCIDLAETSLRVNSRDLETESRLDQEVIDELRYEFFKPQLVEGTGGCSHQCFWNFVAMSLNKQSAKVAEHFLCMPILLSKERRESTKISIIDPGQETRHRLLVDDDIMRRFWVHGNESSKKFLLTVNPEQKEYIESYKSNLCQGSQCQSYPFGQNLPIYWPACIRPGGYGIWHPHMLDFQDWAPRLHPGGYPRASWLADPRC